MALVAAKDRQSLDRRLDCIADAAVHLLLPQRGMIHPFSNDRGEYSLFFLSRSFAAGQGFGDVDVA